MRFIYCCFIMLLLFGEGLISAAQAEWKQTSQNPDSVLQITLRKIEGTPLSLEEALKLTMEQGTAAKDAAAAYAAARGSLSKERGMFDPELFANAQKSSEKQPSASPFSGAAVVHPEREIISGGARVKLPFGTELQASLNTEKLETNSTLSTLSPQYNAYGELSVKQPLLKGFGPAANGDARSARRNYQAETERYKNAILDAKTTTTETYWDLYAAMRDYAVQQLIRETAAALLNEAELRAKAGLVGPNQVANAQVFLAEQELGLYDMEDMLNQTSDRLSSLIGRRPDGALTRFIATDEPPSKAQFEGIENLIARALENNHEILAVEADLKSAKAKADAAKWNALPTLDLLGTFGGNGLSGTGRDVIFGTDTLRNNSNTVLSDAVSQVTGRDYPTWMVGLNLTLPITFREGRGEYKRLNSEKERAEQRLIAVRRDIEERVRSVHRELVHGEGRIAAAKSGVDASQEQVRIGLIEYQNGKTTAFELVRLGSDLASANRRYSQALVRTAKAEANLKQLLSADHSTPEQ